MIIISASKGAIIFKGYGASYKVACAELKDDFDEYANVHFSHDQYEAAWQAIEADSIEGYLISQGYLIDAQPFQG